MKSPTNKIGRMEEEGERQGKKREGDGWKKEERRRNEGEDEREEKRLST